MTFDEYQKGVMRTASGVCVATKDNMLFNGVLGAAGESGELADLLKKQLFHDHPFDREHYIKECGDVLYYLALITEALDTTLEEVAITNNKKLWERYPDGFSVEKSLHRKGGGYLMTDNINHPSHYETGKFECIDIMLETQGLEAVKNFCVCNAFKYIYRHDNKNGDEDLKKAAWYLKKYFELEKQE